MCLKRTSNLELQVSWNMFGMHVLPVYVYLYRFTAQTPFRAAKHVCLFVL